MNKIANRTAAATHPFDSPGGSAMSPPSGLESGLGSGLDRALRTAWGRAVAVVVGSLFVAMCAQVAVPLPWTPVPMTMQPFAVLLVGLLLGPGLGASAMIAYLLEGAAGLPVFVPGFGGLLPLGPSAGYLLAYPAAAALAGLLLGRSRSFVRALLGASAASALVLLSGTCWLALATHSSFAHAAALGMLPFAAGDAVKVVLAALLATGAGRLRRFHEVDTREPA